MHARKPSPAALVAALVLAVLLAGCGSPETRLRGELPLSGARELLQPVAASLSGGNATTAGTETAGASGESPSARFTVVLDAGHQSSPSQELVPLGPGSLETTLGVTGGAVGVVTRKPEYEHNLAVARLVRDRLRREGVRVVMVRTENDVDLTNPERAAIGNREDADLLLRLHCDSSTDRSEQGVSTLYPAGNDWVRPISSRSLMAAKSVQQSTVLSTGGQDLGLSGRADLTGFNWSEVPSVLVEMGFLSNPDEDRLLSTEAYRGRLAEGITRGTMRYLLTQGK